MDRSLVYLERLYVKVSLVALRYRKAFNPKFLGKLQGSGTNMTIKFLWENSLKYLPSKPLLSLKNSYTELLLFLGPGV